MASKIYLLTLALVLFELLVSANGQVAISGKYYRPILQKANWSRAYQLCAAWGMQLASIETESDLMALRQFMFANSLLSNSYWLAGNNLADREEYVWLSSGHKLSYTKWAPSQPGTLADRCIRTNSNFDWISDACSNENYFICSRPLVPDCGVYGRCSNNYYYVY